MLATAVTLALVVVAMAHASPAYGQDAPDTTDSAVVVLLDVSGSMLEDAGNGQPKIEVARKALRSLLADLPDDAEVGLRVYGSQLPPGPDGSDQRRRNCERDTEQLFPVDRLNRRAMTNAVNGIEALGDTPISLGLEAAAGDIPDGTLGTIVLISDGRDECFPFGFGEDPSKTAAKLFDQGIRVRKIETVGFQVDDDPKAVKELEEIATAANGSFTPVEDAGKLADRLRPIILGSLNTAERLGGEAVDGSLDPEDAPELTPGRYTDVIEPGTSKYYRIAAEDGVPTAITASVFELPARLGIAVRLENFAEDLESGSLDVSSPNVEVVREEAGIDRTGADSVRIQQAWSLSGASSIDLYYRLTLDAEESLADEYYVELDYELPRYDEGEGEECPQGSECYFKQQVAEREEEVEALRAEIDDVQSGDERVEELRAESVQLANAVVEAQAALESAEAAQTRATVSLIVTVALVLLAIVGGVLGLSRRDPRRSQP